MASHVRPKRILVLVHEDLIPPESLDGLTDAEIQEIRTEDDVIIGLEELGHHVKVLGLYEELAPLRETLESFQPHIVFNLLEEFRGQPLLDYHMVAYLVLRKVAYTGCNPRGLLIARDKALSKKILHYHRIRVHRFATFPRGRRVRRPKRLTYTDIVKSQTEKASYGIAQASVVTSDEALQERVQFIHQRIGTAAIAEQFVEGRELYVAVMGNQRVQTMPPWELDLSRMPDEAHRIATRKVKFDLDYQEKHKIEIRRAANLSDVSLSVEDSMKLAFEALDANDDQLAVASALDQVLGDSADGLFGEAPPEAAPPEEEGKLKVSLDFLKPKDED